MRLTGESFKQLRDALVAAFIEDELHAMLFIKLELDLDAIVQPGPRITRVENLIHWADRNGRTQDLLNAAKAANPNNTQLSAVELHFTAGQPDEYPPPPGPVMQVPKLPKAFVKRPKVEQAVRDLIMAPAETRKIVNIYGPPGNGRSFVAMKVAHDLQEDFTDGILYANTNKMSAPADILRKFIVSLDTSADQSKLEDTVVLLNRLTDLLIGKRVLIILDKVKADIRSRIADFLPEISGPFVVVIVSDGKILSLEADENTFKIPEFEPDEAVQLFRVKLPDKFNKVSDSVLRDLAETLYYNPRRISIHATNILEQQVDPAVYLERLRSEDNLDNPYSDLEEVYKDLQPDAQKVLPHTGVMSNWAWSLDVLINISHLEQKEIETGLRQLESFGFIDVVDGNHYRISPLTRDFAFAKLEDIGDGLLAKASRLLIIQYYLNKARDTLITQRNALINEFLRDPDCKQQFENALPSACATYLARRGIFGPVGEGMIYIDIVQDAFEWVVLADPEYSKKWSRIIESIELMNPAGQLAEAFKWSFDQQRWSLLRQFALIPGNVEKLEDVSDELYWQFGVIESNFVDAAFYESTLHAVRLKEPVWRNCKFNKVDWLGVYIHNGSFKKIDVSNAEMPGLVMFDCHLEEIDLQNANLNHAVVTKCNFRDFEVIEAEMRNMVVADCDLTDYDAWNANLQGTTYRNCSFSNTKFNKADLTDVHFINCKGDNVHIKDINGEPVLDPYSEENISFIRT